MMDSIRFWRLGKDDAENKRDFPREYDTWTTYQQEHYEKGRLDNIKRDIKRRSKG